MGQIIRFQATLANLPQMLKWIRQQLQPLPLETVDKKKFEVAAEEILVNIIHYAYEDEEGELEIEWIEKTPFVHVAFKDFGKPFNPLIHEKPVVKSLSMDYKDIGGLGIFFVRKFADKVEYHYKDNTNVLTISKRIS
jgi:anti-sigma regulatory factor (Ser/Thr protein kinase)